MSDNQYFEQTPDEVLPYFIDWATLLAAEDDGDGDTISTSDWTVSPSGLTLQNSEIDSNSTRAVIDVSGGTDGVLYTLTNTIETVGGLTFEDYLKILIRDYS